MIIFVDPGKTGGAVTMNGMGEWATHAFKDVGSLAKWVDDLPIDHAVIEQVHASGQMIPTQSFEFGRNLGHWEGVLSAVNAKITVVKPFHWQRPLKLPKASSYGERKKILYRRSVEVVGRANTSRALCDAWLIGYWWAHHGDNEYLSEVCRDIFESL